MMEEEMQQPSGSPIYGPPQQRVEVWFRDESTFYANDRRAPDGLPHSHMKHMCGSCGDVRFM